MRCGCAFADKTVREEYYSLKSLTNIYCDAGFREGASGTLRLRPFIIIFPCSIGPTVNRCPPTTALWERDQTVKMPFCHEVPHRAGIFFILSPTLILTAGPLSGRAVVPQLQQLFSQVRFFGWHVSVGPVWLCPLFCLVSVVGRGS